MRGKDSEREERCKSWDETIGEKSKKYKNKKRKKQKRRGQRS